MEDTARNYPLEDIDRETMFHPNTSIVDHLQRGPHIVSEAHGVRVRDRQGRDLIDCCAGLWCVNIGYGRKEMAEAASKAIERLAYYHIFAGSSNEPIIRLAERVLGLLHKAGATHLSKVFFGSGGSDANDTNIKLVRYYNNLRGKPEKKKLISRFGAYHGLTAAAGSLTGIPAFHKAFDLPLPGVLHVSCPHHCRFAMPHESEAAFTDRLIGEVEALIAREGAETIAAFIAERVSPRASCLARVDMRFYPNDARCGARTRAGTPCRRIAEPGARRCRLHGGASTGPRTPEGRRRIGDAQRGSMGTLATGAQRPVNCAAPVLGDAPVR